MTRAAIGIDVGGTKIAGAVVDLASGAILDRARISTGADEGGAAVAARIGSLIAELQERATGPLVGVGLGLPELVSAEGRVRSAYNCDLSGVDWAEVAAGLPVWLDSDVRCGARAEMHFGAGRPYGSFSYVSIGTGISAAQVIGRHLHTGVNGFAIHFGSSDLLHFSPDGIEGRFNLEFAASGQGLTEALGPRATLAEVLSGSLGRERQRYATTAIRTMASYLGQMVNMLDPEAMIVGGGLGLAPGYIPLLRESMPEFIWAEDCRGLPVLPAALGADSGALGAAALWADQR